MGASLDERIARRLKALRQDAGWSLEALAGRCGVSRATLSRLENGEVSPTAAVLGRLAAAHGLPLSQLMAMVEPDFSPLVAAGAQPVWRDPETGFVRRQVSPPSEALSAELLLCELPGGACIDYPRPPRPGLEHHLYLLDGRLTLTVEGRGYDLGPGDCLRYRLFGPARFETAAGGGARYLLAVL